MATPAALRRYAIALYILRQIRLYAVRLFSRHYADIISAMLRRRLKPLCIAGISASRQMFMSARH